MTDTRTRSSHPISVSLWFIPNPFWTPASAGVTEKEGNRGERGGALSFFVVMPRFRRGVHFSFVATWMPRTSRGMTDKKDTPRSLRPLR